MRTNIKQSRGFTLVELLIVIAVIAILSGMAIPRLVSSRMSANETSAIQAVRMIGKGMEGYRISNRGGDNGYPADFTALGDLVPAEIDPLLAGGTRSGYVFSGGGDVSSYTISAVPETYGISGELSFLIDESGVIRSADKGGAAATRTDPPLN